MGLHGFPQETQHSHRSCLQHSAVPSPQPLPAFASPIPPHAHLWPFHVWKALLFNGTSHELAFLLFLP